MKICCGYTRVSRGYRPPFSVPLLERPKCEAAVRSSARRATDPFIRCGWGCARVRPAPAEHAPARRSPGRHALARWQVGQVDAWQTGACPRLRRCQYPGRGDRRRDPNVKHAQCAQSNPKP